MPTRSISGVRMHFWQVVTRCHIRTVDGSSFKCDIQVSEDRRYDANIIRAEYSLSVTRVDPEELDGLTYAEWISEEV